jgi:N4-(beta-N-acetylglucosaminyl)-L-asparaginase
MMYRRSFLQSTLSWLGLSTLPAVGFPHELAPFPSAASPIVLSTWAPNVKANAVAWAILSAGGRALDAVEAGVKIPEADPEDQSVGYGGLPDRDGRVTLDSCIMDEHGNCGAVMCLEHILHPISVARLVMERTPHVQLVGAGALQFALSQGFTKQNLLTPQSEAAWRNWLRTSKYDPMITVDQLQQKNGTQPVPGQINNHDTIGMIAIDAKGNLSGACTTSGMAFKMHGRVGDSPIVGAGLFVDNEVGAATATGVGEEMVRMCGAHTIVELMRQGYTADEACKRAIERVIKKHGPDKAKSLQVGFLALRKDGNYGAASVVEGFNYAYRSIDGEKVMNAKPVIHAAK